MYHISIILIFSVNIINADDNNNYFNIPIKVTQGVYWTPLPRTIIYESSAPLIYKGHFPTPNMDMNSEPLAIKACVNRDSEWCAFAKWIDTIDKNIETELIKSNTRLTTEADTLRYKRSLDFVGDFLRYCCSVATKSDFKALFSDQNRIRDRIDSIKKSIDEDHVDLIEVSDKMESLSHSVRLTIQELQANFSSFVKIMQSDTISAYSKVSNSLASTFHATERNARRIFEILNLMRRSEVISDCRDKQIPSSMIPAHVLKYDLELLQNKTLKENYDLAIPISELTWYYKLKISECEIAENHILVRVKIPLKNTKNSFKLYEFLSVPFSWNASTCSIVHDSTYLAVSGDSVRSITGTLLRECAPRSNDLCYLPRYGMDTLSGPLCPEMLFKGATASTLNQYCAYKCQTGTAPLITQIDFETYVITHPTNNTYIKCDNKKQYIHENNLNQPGSIELKLPCACSLYMNDIIKIAENYPCEKLSSEMPQVTHILPALWSKLESINLKMNSPLGPLTFNNFSECLNYKWPESVPHFRIRRTKSMTGEQNNNLINNQIGWIKYLLFGWNILITVIIAAILNKIILQQFFKTY